MDWIAALLIFPLIGIAVNWLVPASMRAYVPVLVTALNVLNFVGYLCGLYGHTGRAFNTVFQMDKFSAVITGITIFVGFTAALYSVGYMHKEEHRGHLTAGSIKMYFGMFLLFYFTLLGAPLFQNVLITWGFIEATALASVLLVDFHRTKRTAEASWKYIIMMEIGGICALFGAITFLVGQPSFAHAVTWTGLEQIASAIPTKWLMVGFALVLAGYGTKAGLVPFHAWLPDAHSQAPSPTSAMLSAIKLNCALYAIIRFQTILTASGNGAFANRALLSIGILTVVVATLVTIRQHDVKRLFAYSSSENMGLAAIAFALGPIGVFAGLLQMVNHSVIKAMLFYQSGELLTASGSTEINRLNGITKILPWTGATLMLGMLAIGGAPPFGLFLSEFTVVYSLYHASPWLAVIVLILIAILFANFLRYAIRIGFGTPVRVLESKPVIHTGISSVSIGLHMLTIVALGTVLPFGLQLLPSFHL